MRRDNPKWKREEHGFNLCVVPLLYTVLLFQKTGGKQSAEVDKNNEG
jgi:hypothetical protein